MRVFLQLSLTFLCVTLVSINSTLAQSVSTPQTSDQDSLRQTQERIKKLEEQLTTKTPSTPEIENQTSSDNTPKVTLESEKVLIKTISYQGNTVLTNSVIDSIKEPFEGKVLSFKEMQKIADLITDAYRQKGFITSRAILPPQKIQNNLLEINIIEGKMGQIQVKNNHYFKKAIFIRRFSLKNGEIFNYNQIHNDLISMNKYPDRNVRITIIPGQNPNETDVILEVKEKLPIHVGFTYDNFGSRYIGKSRFTGKITHNNILGFDDILSVQYQGTNAGKYQLNLIRYLVPLNNNANIGVYSATNKIQIGKEFKNINARAKSKLYGIFINQNLYSNNSLKIQGSLGFDYKDVFNFQIGSQTSADRTRIAKIGTNFDYSDNFLGRNIFNNEIHFGIPNILSGLHDIDSNSSRVGAGGRFTKDIIDYLRLQTLPLNMSFLFKFQAMFSSTILPSTEQFQIGGIGNVRGFVSGESVGDSGQSITGELNLPAYFIPRSIKVPFSKETLYNSLKFSLFYDWGHTHFRNPQAGERKARIIDSYGTGVRFTLPESFFLRLDFAWPLTGRPSDAHNQHTWLQISKDF